MYRKILHFVGNAFFCTVWVSQLKKVLQIKSDTFVAYNFVSSPQGTIHLSQIREWSQSKKHRCLERWDIVSTKLALLTLVSQTTKTWTGSSFNSNIQNAQKGSSLSQKSKFFV